MSGRHVSKIRKLFLIAAFVVGGSASVDATTIFNNLGTYNSTVGAHVVIDFQGLVDGTVLTNQFAGLGATFTDGDDEVDSAVSFTDGIGMRDLGGSTTIQFSSALNHFGVEFPGAAQVDLYDGVNLVSSTQFGGSGGGFFGGVLEMGATFDRVVLSDFFDGSGFYDNLHFGFAEITQVPEPGPIALFCLGLAALGLARRGQQKN